MKILLTAAFLMVVFSSWSQTFYNSNKTIHIPSEITEDILRTVIISENKELILINSFPEIGKIHHQLLVVKSFYEKVEHDGTYMVFDCLSADEIYPSLVYIRVKQPEHIAVIQPSIESETVEIFHLVLENIP